MDFNRPPLLMPLYTDHFRTRWYWLRTTLLYIGLILTGCFYGLVAALLPTDLMLVPLAPVGVLFLVILWMLPDLATYPEAKLQFTFRWFIVLNVVWPLYIAINAPGLPWITPARAVLSLLIVLFAFALATSADFRAKIMAPLKAHPIFKWALFLFLFIQFATIALSPRIGDAMTRWGNHQVYEGFIFFAAIWYFQYKGNATRMMQWVLCCAIVVALIGIWETAVGHVPWANHVPPFFSVDPAYMAIVLGAQMRTADGIYRAHSVFTVSLVFSEYLAMAMPILIDRMVNAKGAWKRPLLMAAWCAILMGIYSSNSRLGMVGFFASHLIYLGIWGIRRWRSMAHDLVGPAAVMGYPVALLAFAGVVMSSRTLYVRLIGGGQHGASDAARDKQWAGMWPLLAKNPIGHGPDQAADLINYSNGNGQVSLDAYPINLLVDFGILGFGSFLIVLFYPVIVGLNLYSRTRNREFEMAGVAAVILLVFAIGKIVLSIGSNNYLAYAYIAMILALVYRASTEEPEPEKI